MPLALYKKKRDFKATPEPAGSSRPGAAGNLYIVQKHDATRLHYDFRLQIGDVLASWAVPKGPSLDPANKRLAVHVEDHPLEYGGFEGTIPKGQYGGGTVMLWDRGTWTPEDADPKRALAKGKLSFTLHGEKLRGGWTLTRIHGSRDGDGGHDNWLLIKHDDEEAVKGEQDDSGAASVKTGRTLEEIAEANDASWDSSRGLAAKERAAGKGADAKGGKNGSASKGAGTRSAGTSSAARGTKGEAEKRVTRKSSGGKSAASKSGASANGHVKGAAGGGLAELPHLAGVEGAKRAAMPRVVSPELCTLTDRAPEGAGWIHEIKFDGYRLVALRSGESVKLLTRTGEDWTRKFGPLVEAVGQLGVETAVIDGEATVLDAQGHSSFQRLQNAIKLRSFASLVYYVFDLVYLNGYDLTRVPLVERKKLLRALVPSVDRGVLRYSDHVVGGGEAVKQNACELALEGIISKRADSVYASRRTRDWLKVKCSRRQEFVVIGWSPPEGSRAHFGSLLLGAYDAEGKLFYTGRVGTGFTGATLKEIGAKLKKLERKSCPADEPPTAAERRGVTWVEPRLVAEIEFTEWTDDGRLRHPSFEGLREDKGAAEVRVEEAGAEENREKREENGEEGGVDKRARGAAGRALKSRAGGSKTGRVAATARKGTAGKVDPAINGAGTKARETTKAAGPSKAGTSKAGTSNAGTTAGAATTKARRGKADEPRVLGVRISNPQRVLYPDGGLTKLDIAEYYGKVAEVMLPFVEGRPLSTVRCPQGSAGQCFYQKHLGETFSAPIKAIRVKEGAGEEDYISVDSAEGIVTLVQFGVLEIHPWGSTKEHLEEPDVLIFDLDPGEGVTFEDVKAATREVNKRLEAAGLETFLKTTGGKGLHVVAPVAPEAGWDEAKGFCEELAKKMAADAPDKYIATLSKAKRRGLIFVDYLRNGRGSTAVAPYSTRARAGAPVATPLRWSELAKLERANAFSIDDVVRRLERQREDPWAGFHERRRSLAKVVKGGAGSRGR